MQALNQSSFLEQPLCFQYLACSARPAGRDKLSCWRTARTNCLESGCCSFVGALYVTGVTCAGNRCGPISTWRLPLFGNTHDYSECRHPHEGLLSWSIEVAQRCCCERERSFTSPSWAQRRLCASSSQPLTSTPKIFPNSSATSPWRCWH